MTVFNILGFFQLKSGRRVPTVKPNSSYTVWHIHYNTHVWCANDTQIAAELRLYGTNGTPTLPDGTVAFALCKAQSSPNAVISLDAVTFIPMPGDPTSNSYDDHLPDVHTSFVFAIGHITGAAETLDDGHSSRAFPLAVSDYVGNGTAASTIQAVYDLSTARFKSTPIPALNSCVEIYGACRELNPTGILRIKVESIALNVGANANASATASTSTAGTASTPQTPQKRRKFSPPPSDSPSKQASSTTIPIPSGASPQAISIPSAAVQSQSVPSSSHFVAPAPPTGVSTGPYNPMGHYTPYFSHYYGQPSPFPMTAQYPPYFPSPQFLPDHQSSIPERHIDEARQVGSPSARTSDQDAAFLKSAADPYAYPMTQRRV
ncbi:hypothetical protein B0H19DRAFT_1161441 [Mycena capillaripes]|nr:hypothetical protein B0H19DRAFT_1161441 [Mycena capillaripes]